MNEEDVAWLHNAMHIVEQFEDEEHALEALSDEQYELYMQEFLDDLSAQIDLTQAEESATIDSGSEVA